MSEYYVDNKTPTISFFNNSEKLVQIILEFSQQNEQIVEGTSLCWQSCAEKDPISQPKSAI